MAVLNNQQGSTQTSTSLPQTSFRLRGQTHGEGYTFQQESPQSFLVLTTLYATFFSISCSPWAAPFIRPPLRESEWMMAEMDEKRDELRRQEPRRERGSQRRKLFITIFCVGWIKLHFEDSFQSKAFFFQLKSMFSDKYVIIHLAQVMLFQKLFSHIYWHATLDLNHCIHRKKWKKLITNNVTALTGFTRSEKLLLLSKIFISENYKEAEVSQ